MARVHLLRRLCGVPVPYEYLIRIDKKYNLKAEELAPLTDAGLTPYRGIKKLRNAGALGPDRVLAVIGIGGLGTYAVQYAKLLSSGAAVVAFGRSDEKLAVAKEYGADHVINTRGKSIDDIRKELLKATGHNEIDAAVDYVARKRPFRWDSACSQPQARIAPWAWWAPGSTFPCFLLSRGSSRITVLFGAITTISAKS